MSALDTYDLDEPGIPDVDYDTEPEPAGSDLDADLALWVMSRLDEEAAQVIARAEHARRPYDEHIERAEARIARIDEYQIAELERIATKRRHWEQRALQWYRAHLTRTLARNPKAPKTLKLPNGTLSAKKQQDRAEVVDRDAFMAWAGVHMPALINPGAPPTPSPALNPIKAAVAAEDLEVVGTAKGARLRVRVSGSDELVPGLAFVIGDDEYTAVTS